MPILRSHPATPLVSPQLHRRWARLIPGQGWLPALQIILLVVASSSTASADPPASADPASSADPVSSAGTRREQPRAPLTESARPGRSIRITRSAELPAARPEGFVELKLNTDQTTEIQNEEQLAVNPLDPDNLVAVWRDFRFGYRQVGYASTFDGGETWSEGIFVEPQYQFDSDPGITADRYGNFYAVILSFTDFNSNGLFVLKSTDGGSSWGPPMTAVNNAPHFEDKELIACDRGDESPYADNLYVAWARFYAADIMCVRSTDGGQSFLPPVTVSDHSNNQWPVPVVGRFGVLYVAWVDFSEGAIKLDLSADGGQTFGVDRTLTTVTSTSTQINGGVDVFSFPALEADISIASPHLGRLYVAYMDRTGSDYDILLRWSDDFGTTWTSPVRINDDPQGNGRDQFHPWLTLEPDGTLHAVWLDRRHDPGNLLYDCYVSRSTDGGATWEANRRVSTVSSDPNAGQLTDAGLLGEYIGLAAAAGRVWPLWTDTRLGDQDAWVAYETGTGAVADDGGSPGRTARIGLARPNPFNPTTHIPVQLGGEGWAELRIHDALGRLVRQLRVHVADGGEALISWDGRDEAGRSVGSGVYYPSLAGEESAGDRSLVLVR